LPLDDPARTRSRRIAISRTHTRERVRFLLEEGLFVCEVAEVLEISRPTVCYHKRKLGYEMRAAFGRRYNWALVNRYYQAGNSRRMHEVVRVFRVGVGVCR
jgi:hypothetical protein